MPTKAAKNIDEYIATFPAEVQELLQQIRAAMQQALPDAKEAIKYAMPTFVMDGQNLVHFAAFKNHIGFYGTPSSDFAQELAPYKQGKGSVQFPLNEPLPLDLMVRLAKYRDLKKLGKNS